jgi:TM2 domain-containing membrane protein YozV
MSVRCPKCGGGNVVGYMGEWECMDCGCKFRLSTSRSNYRFSKMPEWKNPAFAAVLALIFGFFILMGIGHIYVGRVRRGIAIMIIGLMLIPFGIVTGALTYGIGFLVTIALWLALLIWQTLDAYNLAKEYNRIAWETGRAPW